MTILGSIGSTVLLIVANVLVSMPVIELQLHTATEVSAIQSFPWATFTEKPSVPEKQEFALVEDPNLIIDVNTPPDHILEILQESLNDGITTSGSNLMMLLKDYCIYISPSTGENGAVKYARLDGGEQETFITSNGAISMFRHLGDGQFLVGITTGLSGHIGESHMYYLYQIVLEKEEITYIDGLEVPYLSSIGWVNDIPYKLSRDNGIYTITTNPFDNANQQIINNITKYCMNNGKLYYQTDDPSIMHSFDFSTNAYQDDFVIPSLLEIEVQSDGDPAILAVYDNYLLCMISRGETQDLLLVDFDKEEIIYEEKDTSPLSDNTNILFVDDAGFYTARSGDREPGPFNYYSFVNGKNVLADGQFSFNVKDGWIYFLADTFFYPDHTPEHDYILGKMRKDGGELTWIA